MATTPELAAAAPVPAWRQKVAKFWRWWTGELGQMLPRFASLRGGRVPLVAFEGQDLLLLEPRAPGGGPGERVALETLDAPRRRAAVRALLERAGETRGRVRLALGRHDALVRRVTMPAATEENLASVLGFEMDRLTPFRADEVYFDHRIVGRDAATGTLTVLLAVARRDMVDPLLQSLRDLGLSVQGVTVREDTVAAVPALDVLPSAQRGERETPREAMLKRALAVAVVVLLLAALLLPIYGKRATVVALHPVLAKAQSEAQATDALVRELEGQVGDYNFLLAKKHATPPALAYIEDVSRLLPDNTWLQQLDIKTAGKARELQISGETASSSKLIEILEQSTLLRNAMPRGTVTRGSQPGTERFVIAAETRSRTPPEARPVSEMLSAPTPPAPPAAAPAKPAPPVATVTPVAPAATPGASPPAPPAAPTAGAAPPAEKPKMNLIFQPRGKTAPDPARQQPQPQPPAPQPGSQAPAAPK